MRSAAVFLLALLGYAGPAAAVECQPMRFDGTRYTICEAAMSKDKLSLFRADEAGTAYGHFDALERDLQATKRDLVFAMNAGMYHDDRTAVGYYLERGRQEMRVVSNAGPGNFGLLPNGIFCISDQRADVFETRDFLARKPECRDATQSGPMLVIDGALHPRFLPDSSSRYIRNGVGTSADGQRVVFAISDQSVTFHEFARLFRDGLKLPNALFLDGNVSRLYAKDLNRSDNGRRMGPIVAITTDMDPEQP